MRIRALVGGAFLVASFSGAATPVLAQPVSCGEVLTSSTTLSSDLTCPSDGLVIGRDGITLDLGGHTIRATTPQAGIGVDLADHSGVTVRNGTLDGFFTHVQLGRSRDSVSRARIVGLRLVDGEFATDGYADRSFIAFDESADTRRDVFELFGGDFQVTGDRNLVMHDSARANALAVIGDLNRVINNRVSNLNSAPGAEGGTLVEGNVAQTLQAAGGSPTAASPTVTLLRNRSIPREPGQPYTQGGILLVGASHTLVKANTVVIHPPERPSAGIEVIELNGTPTGNTIAGNFVQGALDSGIFVESGAIDTLILRNVAIDNGHEIGPPPNGQDGILNLSPTSTLTGNVANDNTRYGIESVPGATDGGGNRAEGNGNPLQCLNVVCR